MEIITEIANPSIDELSLSTRARLCLKRANICDLDTLCLMTEEELLGLRNFGLKSLSEIRTVLTVFGRMLNG